MKMFIVGIISVIILLFIGSGFVFMFNKPASEIPAIGSVDEESYSNALYPIRVDGKWGYMNNRKEIVIDCKFEKAEDFNDGFAIVERRVTDKGEYSTKTLIGFIDEKGMMLTDFKYDRAFPFSDEMALVMKDEKYGYIDKTGKEVISLQYEDGAMFSEGLAAVKVNGKNGFINKHGEMVIKPAFERACHVSEFSDGLAPVYTAVNDGPAGYIDPAGKMVIPAKYAFVDKFSEGVAMVRPLGSIDYGYINKKGEWVIEPQFDMSLGFYEGVATVKERNADGSESFGIIDKTGKKLAQHMNYNFVGIFREGLAAFETKDFAWGYIDRSGKEVIPARYASPKFFVNGLARMEMGSLFTKLKITYINKKGQIVWKEK
jgi:hypothetical protein